MSCEDLAKSSPSVDLNNKLTFPCIPDEIIFPEELNRYLRDQLRYFMHENGIIKKKLTEYENTNNSNDIKIKKLEAKLNQYEDATKITGLANASQVASCRIVELTKKVREKNAEVESLKTRYSKLEKHVLEIKKEAENNIVEPNIPQVNSKQHEDEYKKLQDKFNATNNKLSEVRNLNLQLKNELKCAQKILQQETGENVDSIQNLMSSNNSSPNWRGRAQIICDLQQKNLELKEKLKLQQAMGTSVHNTSSVKSEPTSETHKKINKLSQDYTDLKTSHDSLKKKYDGLKARCRILDHELTSNKTKMLLINQQSQKDQDDILQLKSQLSTLEQSRKDILRQKDVTIQCYQAEQQALKCEIQHLQTILNEIKSGPQDESHICLKCKQSPLNIKITNNNGSVDSSENILGQLEVEKMRLVELVQIQNKRVQEERELHAKTQLMLKMEKQTSARLEANLARMQLESKSHTSLSGFGYSSNCQTNTKDLQTCKNELELTKENLKILQTRLDIEQQERKLDFQHFVKALNEIQEGSVE